MTFTFYPAIDLRAGRVVRLRQGDPARQTEYHDDPAVVALRWTAAGAGWLHLVNLDGALGDAAGAAVNRNAIVAIAGATGARLQVGGGLRNLEDVSAAFDAGAARAVIGTAAVENPALVEAAVARFGADRIVVGLDARDGLVVTRGWQNPAAVTAGDLGCRMAELGVRHALFTEVGRDGMMTGPAAEMTAAIAQWTGLEVMASGGVRHLADIHELMAYQRRGVTGVVVGRALYEGGLDLAEALRAVAAEAG